MHSATVTAVYCVTYGHKIMRPVGMVCTFYFCAKGRDSTSWDSGLRRRGGRRCGKHVVVSWIKLPRNLLVLVAEECVGQPFFELSWTHSGT